MKKKTKKIILILAGVAALFLLLMTWLYPYSAVGISKTYSYTPDPVVGEEHEKDLNEFTRSFEKDLEEMDAADSVNRTVDRTQYVLPLFEQDWLCSKTPATLSKDDLESILIEVKNARTTLLELSATEDYQAEQRRYLVDSINSLLSLEEEVVELTLGKVESRNTLDIQFGNLHMSFLRNFTLFKVFYERSVEA